MSEKDRTFDMRYVNGWQAAYVRDAAGKWLVYPGVIKVVFDGPGSEGPATVHSYPSVTGGVGIPGPDGKTWSEYFFRCFAKVEDLKVQFPQSCPAPCIQRVTEG